MKKSNLILYASMFALTMCFLWIFAIQREFNLFKVKPLNGVLPEVKVKKFNFRNYYDFSFQSSLEKKIERTFGFREPLIRLYNQYTWDFYKKNPSTSVLIGEDRWLYPTWHLKAKPFTDELRDKFDMQARIIYQLTEILKEYNTELLIGFIPGKMEVYPEHIGKRINPDVFNPINYYCQKFEEYGNINYLDLTALFFTYKDTALFEPFSQTGTHWSNIASVYAADTIFKTFEKLSNLGMSKLDISAPYIDATRSPDNDLELLLNLKRPIKQLDNYYVDVNPIKDSTTYLPKMITVGDSHFWNITYSVPLKEIFSSFPYWYYGNTIYFDYTHETVDDVDVHSEFIQSDYILLLYTSRQAYSLGSDVLAKALISLCIDNEELDVKIENIVTKMDADSVWRENIRQKAIKNNMAYEEAAYKDALFLINGNPYKYFTELDVDIPSVRNRDNDLFFKLYNESQKPQDEIDPVVKIMNDMRRSKEWMDNLKEKAKARNQPVEEVMMQDAKWLLRQNAEKQGE